MLVLFVICIAFLVNATAGTYAEPPPTLDPKPYTVWDKLSVKGSRKGTISIPFKGPDGSADFVNLIRLDLVGDSHARGYAHGYLLAKEIIEFTGPKMDKFYMDQVLNINIDSYPEPLHTILKVIQIKGAVAAPAAFTAAMKWVWDNQIKFTPQNLIDELDGMGEGLCASPIAPSSCDPVEWSNSFKAFNMLPELIRMACTAYGAWGKATGDKGLTQVRALDFGGGPFSNYTVIQVHKPLNNAPAFVSVAFPSFIGVITGVSQSGIGLSEKVWMITGQDNPPGSYDGIADVFVLRDILEKSPNKAAAEAYIQSAQRTWGMWVGIGDYETQTLDLVAYSQANATVYTDVTTPPVTQQKFLDQVAYVDKHTQPSTSDLTLSEALTDFYGNISSETSKIITQYHRTGDVHIASYDFYAKTMYVAIGRVNKDGNYKPEGGDDDSVWKAYNRPSVKFDLNDLWSGK